MANISWFVNRLLAMSPAEVMHRCRKKAMQSIWDKQLRNLASVQCGMRKKFPSLPQKKSISNGDFTKMHDEATSIIAGEVHALRGHRWSIGNTWEWTRDPVTGYVPSDSHLPSRKLNYRDIGKNSCGRTCWELSRWTHLVRVAQVAWLNDDQEMANWVLEKLEHWVVSNPQGIGYQWTSAMEAGIRLVNFTWIDALLHDIGNVDRLRIDKIANQIIPIHVLYVWQNLSMGSSANNHLLGELTGLLMATARWPAMAKYASSVSTLQKTLESSILQQFSSDGGNREQGLHYHLFAFEMWIQSRLALKSAGAQMSSACEQRIQLAAEFFVNMVQPDEPWDYGDSDDAHITPFHADYKRSLHEWCEWLTCQPPSTAMSSWLGNWNYPCGHRDDEWAAYSDSGMAVFRSLNLQARFDASPLGYGSMAAHGHLDALHLSLWYKGKAVVIDPGTGCYFDDRQIRDYYRSKEAHNGPFIRSDAFYPRMNGAFLWSKHHLVPKLVVEGPVACASLSITPDRVLRRTLSVNDNSLTVVDDLIGDNEFCVNWQFAPGFIIQEASSGRMQLLKDLEVIMEIVIDGEEVEQSYSNPKTNQRKSGLGCCSPYFRYYEQGPVLQLKAKCLHSTKLTTVFSLCGK